LVVNGSYCPTASILLENNQVKLLLTVEMRRANGVGYSGKSVTYSFQRMNFKVEVIFNLRVP
jgi:hypothetical protein